MVPQNPNRPVNTLTPNSLSFPDDYSISFYRWELNWCDWLMAQRSRPQVVFRLTTFVRKQSSFLPPPPLPTFLSFYGPVAELIIVTLLSMSLDYFLELGQFASTYRSEGNSTPSSANTSFSFSVWERVEGGGGGGGGGRMGISLLLSSMRRKHFHYIASFTLNVVSL